MLVVLIFNYLLPINTGKRFGAYLYRCLPRYLLRYLFDKKRGTLFISRSHHQGLVVPVIRNADQLSCAGIEKAIGEYGAKVRI